MKGGNGMPDRRDGGSLDEIMERFHRRYRWKKLSNLCVSVLIVLLGVSSFCYGLGIESMPTIFRYMTVDGTVFTTAGAAVFVAVNLVELTRRTELTWVPVYYIRLSSAVAESVIFIVVMFSQLPFFSEHLPVCDRYDSFVMHVLIPVLGITTFIINDSPIGRLKPGKRWHGTWFVTFYAVIIFTLIGTQSLPTELIPYFFLDFRHNWWGITAFAFAFVYGCAYLMGWALSEGNRRVSWQWFRDIARHG